MQEVESGLEMYVSSKRMLFPRFYFLSPEEVLTIILSKDNFGYPKYEYIQLLFEGCHHYELQKLSASTNADYPETDESHYSVVSVSNSLGQSLELDQPLHNAALDNSTTSDGFELFLSEFEDKTRLALKSKIIKLVKVIF